jgi:hypothetical protein
MPRSTERSPNTATTEKRSTQQRPDVSTDQRETGYFAQIPLELLKDKREGISSYTLAVYAAIHSYITFGKTTGAYPNTEQIATRAHCSTRTVERERELLKELGYLTWISGNFKRHQGNAYTLIPSNRRKQAASSTVPQAEEASLFPSIRRSIDRPTGGPSTVPQAEHREPVTESHNREKYRGKCSHSDTACCPTCIVPIVVSPSPRPESQDDDFSADEF